ncbi:response regulator [Elioraea sp.]|uniref:response regulator n=1 Tax=Elioraea sp. TaxID=2185103 RepID=UPI0025BDDF27|nr:response regulator [Elioraea sp.]
MSARSAWPESALLDALPAARRFARVLVGSQQEGDAIVALALLSLPERASARAALYAAIAAAAPDGPADATLGRAGRRMLLLTTLEEQAPDEAAAVLGLPLDDALPALAAARAALQQAVSADVLVIEDEPIIAMDIQALVRRAGHRVVGVAATEAQAIGLAEQLRPSLILADVNLGRGGDGSRAVARILETMRVPVIFVTAYPERLLTGEGREPAFVVTKPFDPTSLAVATYQATAGRTPQLI